jgi:hypothetical protein
MVEIIFLPLCFHLRFTNYYFFRSLAGWRASVKNRKLRFNVKKKNLIFSVCLESDGNGVNYIKRAVCV